MPKAGPRRPLLSLLVAAFLGTTLVVAPTAATITPANAASYSTPSGLRAAVVANNAVTLTWNAVSGAPAYRVQFSTHSNMSSAKTMDLVGTTLAWTNYDMEPSSHSGRLRADHTYYFRVKVISAVDLAHSPSTLSPYGARLKVRTSNSSSKQYLAPTLLKATPRSLTSMYVSWMAVDPGVHYRLRYGTGSSLDKSAVFNYSGGILTGLSAGTTYNYQVATISPDNGTTLSEYSAVAQLTTPNSSVAPAIRIASNNICGYSCGNWGGRRDVLVDSLKRQNPDLMAFQESTNSDDLVNHYNDATNSNFQFVMRTSHASLAYDASRFSVVDSGEHYFNEDSSKNFVWGIVTDKLDGRRLFVASVHLTNSDSSTAQRDRPSEAREVVQTISDNNPDKLPVIIAGDFNVSKRKADHPAVYGTMTDAGYVDPLGNPSDSRYVSKSATAEHRIDVNYASANQFVRRALKAKWQNGYDVDYIWQSRGIRMAMFQIVVDVNTNGDFVGTIATDHNMVVATFHLA